jgi:hypothetical protein
MVRNSFSANAVIALSLLSTPVLFGFNWKTL